MKESGIIFNTEMVRAILEGRKTVTRRPIIKTEIPGHRVNYAILNGRHMFCLNNHEKSDPCVYDYEVKCPFGQIGDMLYVRETFQRVVGTHGESMEIIYAEDYSQLNYEKLKPWKPSIHMPKWAARIWLEITDIRVERVQEITEEQTSKEGIKRPCGWRFNINYKEQFSVVWNSLYYSWSENPWVWVIEFKVVNNANL